MEQLWHVRMNYSLGGHRGSSVNFKYKKLIQVAIIRETIDCEILNLYAKSFSISPSLKRTRTKKNSSSGDKDRARQHLLTSPSFFWVIHQAINSRSKKVKFQGFIVWKSSVEKHTLGQIISHIR